LGKFVLEFSDVAVAHAIELAVAPVFLLTGIGAILAVMTNRLGRVIDRARVLEERLQGGFPGISRNPARGSRRSVTTGKIDRTRHHPMYDDSAPRVHRDRGSFSERLLAF
jgi:hypothetical protein